MQPTAGRYDASLHFMKTRLAARIQSDPEEPVWRNATALLDP
jgi:hypothetical protein